jgi:hypothetical protein
MLPISILSAQKILNLLTAGDALKNGIAELAASTGASIPAISSTQVMLSSISPDMADKQVQLTYPRVCLYSERIKNTQVEKFRSLSGTVAVTAEVWASANLVQQTDSWIHYYVEAMTNILRVNIGDWSDGIFFGGAYDVQFQAPKSGGFGYVQSAKVTCSFNVSRS